jgi:hypothetical protein
MKCNLIIAAALVIAVMSVSTGARTAPGSADGNALYEHCQSSIVSLQGVCVGYVMAMADILAEHEINGFKACVPRSVTIAQATDVVKQFLARYPEQRHFMARGLVAAALSQAFPCR